MNNLLNEIEMEGLSRLENVVGKSTWRDLRTSTKTGIMTSEICLEALKRISSSSDYSASIMPLMRVLENELIEKFYSPYLSFLGSNYTPDRYINENRLDQRRKNPDDLRRKILFYDTKRDVCRFCRLKNHEGKILFTLGDYPYTVGAEKNSDNVCDPTAVRFYKETVFGLTAEDVDIVKWICNLAVNLQHLVELRNNSAHAGRIQSVNDANAAMDALVKVDKLLLTLVFPKL